MTQNTTSLWGRVTAVHPSITDIEQRNYSKLLATILAYLIPVFLIVNLRSVISRAVEGPTPLAIMVFSLMVITFVLNRQGRYTLSANLWIFGNTLIVAYVAFTGNIGYMGLVFFLVFILAILLLSTQSVIILGILQFALIVAHLSTHPQELVLTSTFSLIYFALGGAVMLAFTSYRNKIEAERSQQLLNINEALRQSEARLESRVKERTRDLELAIGVSRQITTVLDQNQLLKVIADQTKEAFKLYHVSVFKADTNQTQLSLAASAGTEPMAERSFVVEKDKGMVPEAARGRTSVLANDVTLNSGHLVNPRLPNTKAELAVPMIANNKLIGVLDLQSDTLNSFSEDIVRVMNLLAEQLAIAVENATLFAEVEQARQEQVIVAEQLRAVDNMKSQFLASMSHELRTPLNAILNFTKFVQTGMLGPVNERQIDALTKAINSGKHLLTLINDVLDITKIESGMLNLFVEEDVELADELDVIGSTAETLLSEKPNVKFVRNYDADTLPDIVCDKRRVRQILLNLVSNACKFTEEGHVTLNVKAENQQLSISVQDTGPGIPLDDHDLIFEPFRQSRAGISKGGGTGLGLPIARRLAEAHGGKLWMESTVGQGTTFYVTLPVESAELKEMIQVGKVSQE